MSERDLLDVAQTGGVTTRASFTLRNRAVRALWMLTWTLLASWTPPPLHAWRCLLLRAFGAKVGAGVRIYGSTRVWLPANLEIGDHALIGWQVHIYNQGQVSIGEYAVVSQFSHLVASTHDIDDPNFQLRLRPVRVEKQAWIASGAFVGPGVTVGEGAVLGARGAAFRDLAPWTVYRGNPAVEVKQRRRFDQPTAL